MAFAAKQGVEGFRSQSTANDNYLLTRETNISEWRSFSIFQIDKLL
jgi:hypothetical protein